MIPIGEKESKNWINSRKPNTHLDPNFLPRSLVYDYGDNYKDSA